MYDVWKTMDDLARLDGAPLQRVPRGVVRVHVF